MEQHLEDGCETCQESLRLWRTVAETANGEVRSEVPDDLLRSCQAAFAEWWRRYVLPKRATFARLIFDSLFEPLPAGVRGSGPAPRRVLERAGRWSVDLRFEPTAGKRMVMTGQVLRLGKRGAEQMNMPVLLMRRGALLTDTVANQFGEFQLQFDLADDLQLYVEVPEQRPIGIILPDLGGGSGAGEPRTA